MRAFFQLNAAARSLSRLNTTRIFYRSLLIGQRRGRRPFARNTALLGTAIAAPFVNKNYLSLTLYNVFSVSVHNVKRVTGFQLAIVPLSGTVSDTRYFESRIADNTVLTNQFVSHLRNCYLN